MKNITNLLNKIRKIKSKKDLINKIFAKFSLWHDQYPPLFWRGKFFRYLSRISIVYKLRVRYWAPIAEKSSLKYFYTGNTKDLPKTDEAREMAKEGFVCVENFLPNDEWINLIDVLEQILASCEFKGDRHLQTKDFLLTDEKVLESFNLSLKPYVAEFFGGAWKLPSIYGQFMYSQDGVDPGGETNNWHADRFIPVINGVYFPKGCDWAPFERLLFSPIITDAVPEIVRHHYKDLPEELASYDVFRSFVPENTLILGAHHILHRRGSYTTPGDRLALYPCWYNTFTARHLCSPVKVNEMAES